MLYSTNALMCIEKAEQLNSNNSVLYYSRAILYFTLENIEMALKDIDKAIEISEENVAAYYYLRG